jgi:hypothetical protein
MISGKFPYDANVARSKTKASQKSLRYNSLCCEEHDVAFWIDQTLKKALEVNPLKRYEEISEFVYDLTHPNPKYIRMSRVPFYERSSIVFWKVLAVVQTLVIFYLIWK